MENALSRLLRYGALLCAALLAIGLLLVLGRGQSPVDLAALTRGETFGDAFVPPSPAIWWEGMRTGQGTDWLRLGLFCLVLLPVLRVGFTVAIFVRDRSPRMAALAGIVFAVLIGSLLMGREL